MRFVSLGSGSRGNATLIEAGDCRVLLDCGFNVKELQRRLDRLGVDPHSLDAILVTHEHSDHIKGAAPAARRFGMELWMSHGTGRALPALVQDRLHLFHADNGSFRIKDLTVTPYTVPHDAKEPCQYLFSSDGITLGVLTDAGVITPHIVEHLRQADALILEANHDEAMLARGPYPYSLKRRVAGSMGHLSNRQAAGLLASLDGHRLQQVAMAHISEKNNCPDLARETLLEAAPMVAGQLNEWRQDEVGCWAELVSVG